MVAEHQKPGRAGKLKRDAAGLWRWAKERLGPLYGWHRELKAAQCMAHREVSSLMPERAVDSTRNPETMTVAERELAAVWRKLAAFDRDIPRQGNRLATW